MKRFICILLTALLLVTVLPAYAEEFQSETDGELPFTVGSMTQVSGAFFTSQFGNNTSDIDVRAMLHGYNPIVWTTQLKYQTDPTVVKGMTTRKDADGNTVYTFTLAEDLCWNDGTPIGAADYVFSYLLQASPQFAQIGADTDVWNHILGYEAYASGQTDCLQGVRLVGEYSFSLTVKAEYLPYFFELSMLEVCPYPIDEIAPGCMVADTEDGAAICNIREEEPAVFTAELLRQTVLDAEAGYLSHPTKVCGPYSLASYDADTGTVDFVINEFYKGDNRKAKPTIPAVRLVTVSDEDIAERMASGEIDLVNKVVDAKSIDSLKELEGVAAADYPRLGCGYLTFACERGPVQFQAVRQAIACALDADAFVQDYLDNYGTRVYGSYGEGQWMTLAAWGKIRPENMTAQETAAWNSFTLNKLDHYDYDLERAAALLEEDGWTLNEQGEDFNPSVDAVRCKDVDGVMMPLRISYGVTEGNRAAQWIADALTESLRAIGAELEITVVPFRDVLDDYFKENGERRFDISFLASNFVSVFDAVIDVTYDENGTGSQNFYEIQDEELLALAWKMHTSGDILSYMKHWQAYQERFNALLPTLPIYSNIYYDFFTDNLQKYSPSTEAHWPDALLHAELVTD